MRKFIKKLLMTGIWVVPLTVLIVSMAIYFYEPRLLRDQMVWTGMWLGAVLLWLLIWMDQLGRPQEETALQGKKKAMYPDVAPELISDIPTGVILGKDRNTGKYVCADLKDDAHYLVIGGSGSGKSSSLSIPLLLSNPDTTFFVIDVKGELSYKSTKLGSGNRKIFNPNDRSTYGYDPFYKLNEKSTAQDILDVMQSISAALVPMSADLKDPFWKLSARNYLAGLLIYFYKEGHHNFIDCIDEIMGRPAEENIKLVMEGADPESAEYHKIVQFSSMEAETLGGIIAEVNNHLGIFVDDQDLRYAFKHNYNKVNPLMLEEQISLFITIEEHRLTTYVDVLQLVINQTLEQLEQRREDSHPVVLLLEELPRILSAGKIARLLDGARTLRSRKVRLFLVTQSIEALQIAYSEPEVTDLISNCGYTVVLSASSSKTQKTICEWCGKYMARKQSWTGEGKTRKSSVSYEEKSIVEPSDLMKLQRTGEAILITPYGYCRVKKAPYYKDPYLKPLAMAVREHNELIAQDKKGN